MTRLSAWSAWLSGKSVGVQPLGCGFDSRRGLIFFCVLPGVPPCLPTRKGSPFFFSRTPIETNLFTPLLTHPAGPDRRRQDRRRQRKRWRDGSESRGGCLGLLAPVRLSGDRGDVRWGAGAAWEGCLGGAARAAPWTKTFFLKKKEREVEEFWGLGGRGCPGSPPYWPKPPRQPLPPFFLRDTHHQ